MALVSIRPDFYTLVGSRLVDLDRPLPTSKLDDTLTAE